MTEKLKQISKEEITKLPKEMQEAINAVGWANISEQIGKKYSLNESEINDFQAQVLLVLLGLRDLEFFEIYIENDVETTKDQAANIANEASEKIFDPIANIIEENIKKNLGNKSVDWQQTVDFILSGGNYFSFIAPAPRTSNQEEEKVDVPLGKRSMQDIKDKLVN